jgi:hypothetical protein
MADPEPQPTSSPPRPRFQFTLRTLLLLFVVLGSSLAVFGGWGILVFGLVAGLAIYLRYPEWFRFRGSLLLLLLLAIPLIDALGMAMATLVPALRATESHRAAACENNLRQIAAALQEYHRAKGCFPPAWLADKTGKPAHSWRVLILPYLGRDDVYRQYDFSKPWNGPVNSPLYVNDLCYVCLSGRPVDLYRTNYVAVVGPNSAWAGATPKKRDDLRTAGEPSRTVMVIEVAGAGIPWAEPRDLSEEALSTAGAKPPAMALAGNHFHFEDFFTIHHRDAGVNVAMDDGSVRFLRTGGLTREELWKKLQIGGCREEDFGPDVNSAESRRLNWPNIAALAVWLLSVGMLLTHAVRNRKVPSVPPPPSVC